MKELNLYIQDLLERHQCVIVPDFGAFISDVNPSEFVDMTLTPPVRKLTFNSMLCYNDGVLCKHISSQENISYDSAVELVGQKVRQWKDMLFAGGVLSLPGLGSIKKADTQDFLIFEPEAEPTPSSKSFFGMGSATIEEAHKEDDVASIFEPQPNPQPAVEPQTSGVKANAESEPQKQDKESFYEKITSYLDFEVPHYFKYLAIGLVGFMLLLMGISAIKKNRLSVKADKLEAVEASSESVSEIVSQYIAQANFFESSPITASPIYIDVKKNPSLSTSSGMSGSSSSISPGRVYLIAGSFEDESNAHRLAQSLRSDGFPNASVIGKGTTGNTLVAFSSYSSRREAVSELYELQEEGFEVWIFTR